MATLEQLEAALRAADAAGNTADAKRLAQAYAAARAAQQPQQAATSQAAPADPTDGMSGVQKFAAGVGKSLVDTGHGLVQAGTDAARYFVDSNNKIFGEHAADGLKARVAQQQAEADARKAQDAPLMNSGAGFAGDVTGQIAQLAAPVGEVAKGTLGLRALAGAAAKNAAFAAVQPVATGESRAQNVGTAAALSAAGHGLQAGVARVGKGMSDKIAPEVMALYQKAQAAGIPVHFSQLSDSKFVKTLASTLGYLPLSGSGAAAKTQQEAFSRAASRGFGANAGNLSDDVMHDAASRLSGEYTSIYKGKHIAVSEFPVRRMLEVVKDAADNLTDEDARVVAKQFDKIVRKAEDGSLTGEQYQALRTSLGSAIDGGKIGHYVKQLRRVLDETAKIGLGPQDAARLEKVQGQWANMKTVQKALTQAAGAGGNIAPGNLWNLVKNGSTKEMRDLAKIGKVLLKDPIPDSGTAGRLLATGGAAGAMGSGVGALPLLKLLALGATVGRGANSQAAARYLAHGNKPISGLARLLQPTENALPAIGRAAQQ